MVEPAIRPQLRVMAGRANRRGETGRDVVRDGSTECCRALPGCLVAPIAIRVHRREGVIVAHVAVGAGHHFTRRRHLVCARQGPPRRAVVEGCRGPGDGTVACRAIRRRKGRSRGRVRRIIRLLPGRQMASRVPAVGRCNRQRVVIVDVARRAGRYFASGGHQLMRIRQREARRRVVKG